jgi:hypothetical protein
MCKGSEICQKILPRPATMLFEERGHFRISLLHDDDDDDDDDST